ncbi:hypothetical protein H5410_032297 [Solanum commersonii]|uniref:RNA helicase n=1 Tax=Solanum commersonii TaxID=4109 RepID=A0A9J5YMH5_SOLCO|nr:hypothetical protein H5410_032297 [Solanum commersonii]
MATIAYKSDDEYSTITDKGDIGFIDFDKYKSAYSYNPNEESDIVVISVPFPLIEGKPKSGFVGETVVDSITIENTTNETLELWPIKIYDSKPEDSFTLSLMKPPTACSDLQYVEEFMESFSLEDRMLQPGRPLTVWLTCKPKQIGLHTSAVHFNVGDDNIERLVFVLAEDKVSQSLTSSRPFHRNRKKKAPAVDVGFVGGSRPMRDSYSIFRHKLLSYPIPQYVREMIEKKRFPNVIGEGLRRDNYVAYFRTLLAIEEIKIFLHQEDMRDYDMESVTMKRRGPHFLSLHVPGLAERRPSLVDGDHIFAKLATTYASEIITPYQLHVITIKRMKCININLVVLAQGYIQRVEAEEFAFNRMGVRRLHQAIEATESLDGEIIFPSVISSTRNIQSAVLAPRNSCMLNKEQTIAVEKILGCEGGAPYVIHGPPGTGKTRTLIEAIIQLHIMRKDARVLVCAPSNSAADHILEKLVSQQNYRCHPAILQLPSEMFYGGECMSIPCKEDDKTWLPPNKEFPLLFIGIQGCDEREGNHGSTGSKQAKQQVLKIRRAQIQSFDWANIKVGSVEQFQGQERQVIIISTVRSTIQHNDFDRIHYLGFLNNPRRFNVAVTRARTTTGTNFCGIVQTMALTRAASYLKNWRSFKTTRNKQKVGTVKEHKLMIGTKIKTKGDKYTIGIKTKNKEDMLTIGTKNGDKLAIGIKMNGDKLRIGMMTAMKRNRVFSQLQCTTPRSP